MVMKKLKYTYNKNRSDTFKFICETTPLLMFLPKITTNVLEYCSILKDTSRFGRQILLD